MTGILRGPRRAALAAIAALVSAATLVSFAESYRGLYVWSYEHGLHGAWAAVWPVQVDVFIAVGELALFVALADAWPARSRAGAWAVTGLGLAVSVAGNVGHVAGHSVAVRATAAVPPLAAAAALAVGLGVLKRVVRAHIRGVPGPALSANGQAHSGSRARSHRPDRAPGTPETAEVAFAPMLAEGKVPSLRAVRRELHVGTDKARTLREHLARIAEPAP